MKYLLDVNVLVAWGWADHAEHEKVARWIGRMKEKGEDRLLTSAIPQLGFVRVSVARTGGQISPEAAGAVLKGMLHSLGRHHEFLADDRKSFRWPSWCKAATNTTDAHLLAIAEDHGAALATLDEGIPGAFVIGRG